MNLDTVASFTWDFGQRFLLQTSKGNFVWSDPEYNGDNTIRPYKGKLKNFTHKGFCGRDKGTHSIRSFCGDKVKFVDC